MVTKIHEPRVDINHYLQNFKLKQTVILKEGIINFIKLIKKRIVWIIKL